MIGAANLATLMDGSITRGSNALAQPAMNALSPQAADKAAKDFESMFIGQMMESMFGDSEGTEFFGGEETAEIYKGLMMDAYGKEIAKAGGIGIADYIKETFIKQGLMNREVLNAQEVL